MKERSNETDRDKSTRPPRSGRASPALEFLPDVGFRTRIRFGDGQRERFIIKTLDRGAAERRDRELRALARMLFKAGKTADGMFLIGKAAEASDDKFPAVRRSIELFVRGGAELVKPTTKGSRTFRDLAEDWTKGEIHRLYPDHVRDIAHDTNEVLLKAYVLPVLGDRGLASIAREDCDEVMRKLPAHLAKNSRRHVAKVVARVLNLAEFTGEIQRSPLPRGWVPQPGAKKDTPVLYPNEDAKLLACAAVPIGYRVFYGFLHREGGRRSETARLAWRELDLENGVLQMDVNKTDHARWWRLSEGVTEALAAWFEMRGRPGAEELVFTNLDGSALTLDHLADRVRDDLTKAGITRARLFDKGENTLHFGTHGFRHSFTTRSLANGRTDDWVRQRTGHTTDQLLTYREAAKALEELELGDLAPLADAVPELRAMVRNVPAGVPNPSRVGHKVGQPSSHRSQISGRGGQIRTADPLTPREEQADASPQEREFIERDDPRSGGLLPPLAQNGPVYEAIVDPVERALSDALNAATEAQRWDLVAQLAGELQARREARSANVVRLPVARKNGGAQ